MIKKDPQDKIQVKRETIETCYQLLCDFLGEECKPGCECILDELRALKDGKS